MEDKIKILRERPDIEEITAHYEKMMAEIRRGISTEITPLEWKIYNPTSRAGCSEFPTFSGTETRILPTWGATGAIPNDKWEKTLSITTEVLKEYGFSLSGVLANGPEKREIAAKDSYGATLVFGTQVNTILTVHTACHRIPGEQPRDFVNTQSNR